MSKLSLYEVYDVCKQLKENSKRTVKEFILNKYKDDINFKLILSFLFDSNVTTGIDVKKLSKWAFNDDFVNNELDSINATDDLSVLLAHIRINNTGRDEEIKYYISARRNLVTQYVDINTRLELCAFLDDIITKSLRLGVDAKTINKVYGYEFVPTFDVQLGTPMEDVKLKGDEEIFISQKLNGTRCIYYNGGLWTRSGKKYVGCQHIINDIKRLCEEDFGINSNEIVFDGELVLKSCGLSDSEAFQKGTGIANSKNTTKEELEYVIFDTMSSVEFEQKKCERRYGARRSSLENLPEIFNRLGLTNIRIVPFFYRGYNHEKIWEYLDYAESNDMEGIMINLDTPYEFKRTKNLIKVKKFYDIDLRCIGIEQGVKGKYKDTLGNIVCSYKGGEVRVGSGFTDEQRNDFFHNPGKIVGEIVTVKYKEATKNKDGSESLQFPVFVTVRFDKNVTTDEE